MLRESSRPVSKGNHSSTLRICTQASSPTLNGRCRANHHSYGKNLYGKPIGPRRIYTSLSNNYSSGTLGLEISTVERDSVSQR